jgi:peroxiredoxin
MPLLLDIEKNYQRDGVSLLGINVEDKPQDAKEFAAKFGIDFPSLVDTDSKLLASLPGVPPNALPSTLVIDRNGQIGARIVGPVKPGVIEEILDGWLTS